MLEAHRLIAGPDGGRYVWANILPLCPTYHTKVHSKIIELLGCYTDSVGRRVVHYRRDGKEGWAREPSIFDKE